MHVLIKSEAKLIKNFAAKYGNGDQVSVMVGDWSDGGRTLKNQASTKGIGFRDLFRQNGFEVFLLDEYKTSKLCPCCHGDASTFKRRQNPRPHRKGESIVHGLLRCQSVICQQSCGYSSRL